MNWSDFWQYIAIGFDSRYITREGKKQEKYSQHILLRFNLSISEHRPFYLMFNFVMIYYERIFSILRTDFVPKHFGCFIFPQHFCIWHRHPERPPAIHCCLLHCAASRPFVSGTAPTEGHR